MQPTWVGWVQVTVTVLNLVEQRPCQQEVLEAHGALAQKDKVRVGRQAQLAVGSEGVETLRLLAAGMHHRTSGRASGGRRSRSHRTTSTPGARRWATIAGNCAKVTVLASDRSSLLIDVLAAWQAASRFRSARHKQHEPREHDSSASLHAQKRYERLRSR